MKEFDKRFPDENTFGNYELQFNRKEGWRAALEWVWKTAEHLSPSDCDLIDDELGLND